LVQRLEERGVASLDHLQRSGAERVLRELCGAQSRWSLLNRLSALEQALATWPHAATTPACITGSTGGHRAASAAGRVE
jgi:hypothetical protein